MDNAALKQVYDDAHLNKKFFSYSSFPEQLSILNACIWDGLKVLEIGCGTGELASMIASAGAKMVMGIDYSHSAIEQAADNFRQPNLYFGCTSVDDHLAGKFDVVVMCGVIEHFDDPWAELKKISDKYLDVNGTMVVSFPGHCNPRGIVWLTLKILCGAVMSKTDLHEILPMDIENFCHANGLAFGRVTAYPQLGYGKKMFDDLAQRIPLALADAGISVDQETVGAYLERLKVIVGLFQPTEASGGAMIYKMVKIQPQVIDNGEKGPAN